MFVQYLNNVYLKACLGGCVKRLGRLSEPKDWSAYGLSLRSTWPLESVLLFPKSVPSYFLQLPQLGWCGTHLLSLLSPMLLEMERKWGGPAGCRQVIQVPNLQRENNTTGQFSSQCTALFKEITIKSKGLNIHPLLFVTKEFNWIFLKNSGRPTYYEPSCHRKQVGDTI